MEVKDGSSVKVEYTGKFDDGTIFDSSKGREPLAFKVGEHMVIPGFEDAVKGMKVNDEKTITISPEQGYGEKQEFLVIQVPKTAVAGELKAGTEFATKSPSGDTLRGRVIEVLDENVVLDFNHPLAGKTLYFDVKVVGIE